LSSNQWELVIVDNASEKAVAHDWNLSWHPRARHVREEQLGLAYARQRGMREASADVLVFVDDDNVVAPDYLSEALRIGREWPHLGAWGGSIVPEFEVEPPSHLERYIRLLALREVSAPRWSNVASCADAEPWGAGLCIRSSVASAYCESYGRSSIRLTGRTGGNLVSGEDTEICYVACSIGLGMGLFPELRVTHLIPKERLDPTYLMRLIEGMQVSRHLLGFKWQGIKPRSPLSAIELLRIAKHVATKRGLDRRAYLAVLRATRRALSIIDGNETNPAVGGAAGKK
jgi:glycosyltransferase involved in cell wall biosynthesis